jgi:hypothetical protein
MAQTPSACPRVSPLCWKPFAAHLGAAAAASANAPAPSCPLPSRPQEAGLPVALLVMLRRAAGDAAAAAATPAPAATPAKKGRAAGKKAAAAAEAAAAREGAAAPREQREAEWLPELAAALCDQVGAAAGAFGGAGAQPKESSPAFFL